MAPARGCSLTFSSDAAIVSSSLSGISYGITCVTCGLPIVIVPVLSRTTVSIKCAASSASPVLINIPFSAPLPVPAIIATGVARPNAQGHEITSTAIVLDSANSTPAPDISHTIPVINAVNITQGTNIPAILSAILAIGALLDDASSTSRIICDIVVSSPTLTASALIYPPLLIEADMILSPFFLATGILSPVIADSSNDASPSVTIPSTPADCPDFTI